MLRKILSVALLGIFFVLLTGCSSNIKNTKLYTSKASATITLQEQMTLYKNMDVHGTIIGTVNAGEYKVLDAVASKDEQGTWVQIEVKGEKGYVFGVLVKKE